MPTYDYHCAANDQTVQVVHPMSQDINTWGDVCALAQRELGKTPADAPVTKVHLGISYMHRRNIGSDSTGGGAFGAMTTTRAYHNTKNFDK